MHLCPILRCWLECRPPVVIRLRKWWPFPCSDTIVWPIALVCCQMVANHQICASNNFYNPYGNQHYRVRPIDDRQLEKDRWKNVVHCDWIRDPVYCSNVCLAEVEKRERERENGCEKDNMINNKCMSVSYQFCDDHLKYNEINNWIERHVIIIYFCYSIKCLSTDTISISFASTLMINWTIERAKCDQNKMIMRYHQFILFLYAASPPS